MIVTKPDVVAPGAQIFSCIPPEKRPDGVFEYTYMNGLRWRRRTWRARRRF